MLSSHSWNLPSSTTFPFNLWSHWWLLTSTSFLLLKLQSCLPLLHTPACPMEHGSLSLGLCSGASSVDFLLIFSVSIFADCYHLVWHILQTLSFTPTCALLPLCTCPFITLLPVPVHWVCPPRDKLLTSLAQVLVPQWGSQWACVEYMNHSVRPEELS